MSLYMVGLGLGDEDDITVKGLKIVQSADVVFLEAYTSVLGVVDVKRLEQVYGKPIQVADRDLVEQQAEDLILQPAQDGKKVAFLVVGDPVCATTHTDLWLRARQLGIPVQVIHNASIMGAAGASGLQLYSFGQTVSVPFFDDSWRPTSFYPKIQYNRKGGLHTLCLLDIKVKEPDFEAMTKGITRYLPPRFMTVNTACEQLLEAESKHQEHAYDGALCVGLARMGRHDNLNTKDSDDTSDNNEQQDGQFIVAGTLQELQQVDFGAPLHSLIICGDLHELEWEVVKEYLWEKSTYEFSTNDKKDNNDAQSKEEQAHEEEES